MEQRIASKVADINYIVVQANLATLVETLVYSYRRDIVLNSDYNAFLKRAKDLLTKVEEMKKQGEHDGKEYVVKNTDKTISIIIDDIQDIINQNSLPTDKSALARALGIHDLEIIRDIKIMHEDLPIEKAYDEKGNSKKLNKNIVAGEAATQSRNRMEILQTKYAIEEAKLARRARFFQFLDPIGNPAEGLGLKLIWESRMDKAAIRAGRFNTMDLENQVRQGAEDTVENYNDALDGYKVTLDSMADRKVLLDDLLSPIENFPQKDPKTGATIPFTSRGSLVPVFEDFVGIVTRLRAYHAAFRIARATLDRMQLQGYYSEVDKILRDNNPPITPPSPSESDCEDDKIVDDNIIDGEADAYEIYSLGPDSGTISSSGFGSGHSSGHSSGHGSGKSNNDDDMNQLMDL